MRLYIFRSEMNEGLCGFAADENGRRLPPQFAPWRLDGTVDAAAQPPHNLSRIRIEASIKLHGFQLWRLKQAAAGSKDK